MVFGQWRHNLVWGRRKIIEKEQKEQKREGGGERSEKRKIDSDFRRIRKAEKRNNSQREVREKTAMDKTSNNSFLLVGGRK